MLDVGNSEGSYTNVRSMVGPTFDKWTFGQYPVEKKKHKRRAPTMIITGGQSGPCQLGSDCQSLDLYFCLIDVMTIVPPGYSKLAEISQNLRGLSDGVTIDTTASWLNIQKKISFYSVPVENTKRTHSQAIILQGLPQKGACHNCIILGLPQKGACHNCINCKLIL